MKALWRGFQPHLVPQAPLMFYFHDALRITETYSSLSVARKRRWRVVGDAICGGLAGTLALAVLYPLDFVRCRMGLDVVCDRTKKQEFQSFRHCVEKTFAVGGMHGFYRGLSVGAFGVFLSRSLYFGTFEAFRTSPSDNAGLMQPFLSAFAAACIAGIVAYPFDTIRRRSMLTPIRADVRRHRFAVFAMAELVRLEGWTSLFRGSSLLIVQVPPAAAMLYLWPTLRGEFRY